MQRPIPATRSLPHAEAKALLDGIRTNLKYRGLTRDPYPMCAEVRKYGRGWAVYVGFQDHVDLEQAVKALGEAA